MLNKARPSIRRVAHGAVALAVLCGVLATVQMGDDAGATSGASVPPVVRSGELASADALPTVQINGVVWDQYVLGNTVYAVGEFTSARPAGSPAGVNEVPRTNMLAYDITTGALIQSFAPTFNGRIKTVTASPDGSRIYVGGLFTNVSGSTKYRMAALDPVTGAVVNTFNPIVNYLVNDIVATNDTVYAVGEFTFAGNNAATPRNRMAAFAASNGALLSWAPSANNEIHTAVMSPAGDRLYVGGKFSEVNGTAAIGLAAIDPTTGAKLSWPVDSLIRNSGSGAAIFTLTTDGTSIFGGGWAWGRADGNLEGSFSADPYTGAINWVQDCHGDTYAGAPVNGAYYTASHAHFCGNVGSFPQAQTWADYARHANAFTIDARGTVRREQWTYYNYEGLPAPSHIQWAPEWTVGTYTGQSQATWAVTGNNDYVVYGGEFLRVNGQAQQGLVRFAVRSKSPKASGPRLVEPVWTLKAVSDVAGQVRLTIPANFDRDDRELTYRFTRNGQTIHTTTVASAYWDQPIVSFTDTGQAPGSSNTYRVWVTDGDGNQSFSDQVPVTVAGTGSPSAYSNEVLKDGARLHWRLGSSTADSTPDAIGTQPATLGSAPPTFGAAGAIIGDANAAATFSNDSQSTLYTPTVGIVPNDVSIEAWVRTSSSRGGRIAGFSNSGSALSSSGQYDRVLYMSNDGSINFGVRTAVEGPGPNASRERRVITSPSGFNNNQWHHVVGTMGADGINLYVDGVRVATRSDVTGGQPFYGRFRVGADTLGSYPNRPSNDYLSGQIDEVALYHAPLSAQQVARHYTLSGRTPATPAPPADSYGAAVHGLDPYLYYRLAETSGTTINDAGLQLNTGDLSGTVTRNQTGAVAGNAATRFNGSASIASRTALSGPGTYSVETWFNTSSSTGGQLIGFGSARTGASAQSDRMLYLRNDGRLVFRAGGESLTTPSAVNNGQWQHVVATQGQNGMALYLNGVAVATSTKKVADSFNGYWRIGGDSTPADSTNDNFTGVLDEVAVYDRELTAAEVAQHVTLAGGSIPNTPPVASFTVGGSFLDLTVDGSGSTDPDGSIQSYAWDFGDGTTGSGATASHTYAVAGNYTVSLTVTDDGGGVNTSTQQVQITAPPPNVVPVASFTADVAALKVNVDAAASVDPDGSIQSYAWNFGDSATGSGQTATHTYAAAGTYTVTLTVTDDDGATGTTTRSVTVTEPTGPVVHAVDSFERSVSNGLGTADTGGAWSTVGTASWYSVADGTGRHLLNTPGRTTDSTLGSVNARDLTFGADVSFDKAPAGGAIFTSIAVRRVGSNEYRLRARILPTGGTELVLDRTAGGVGAVIAGTSLPGLSYTPGDVWRIQLDATGTSPTTLTAKVWNKNGAEPALPQLTATDSTAALQVAGAVGFNNYLSSAATNTPVTVRYDNLLAITGTLGEPIPNQAPVASFTVGGSGLGITVNGSGSNDPDGSIQSYAWNFGDSATGSGQTATHTYAAAGTYTVTLTVTDDDGATGTTTRSVTVTEPTGPVVHAVDSFERSVSNGLGTADTGGAWSTVGTASWYSVADGTGRHLLNTPGRTTDSTLGSVNARDLTFGADVSFDKAPAGGAIFTSIAVRRVGSNEYRLRARILPTGGTELVLDRTAGGVGAVIAGTSLPGLSYTPGDVWRIQLDATGTSPTTLTAKVWNKNGAEPALPQLTATDSTAALQVAGAVGFNNYLSSAATNTPVTVRYDNLLAVQKD